MLVEALREGDERAFEIVVDRHGASMLRLARTFCGSRAVAEEVVQETWMVVLTGIDRFEGRSSLSTWLLRILVNRAKSRGARERRMVPMSALADPDDESETVPADRFLTDDRRWPGHWASAPRPWNRPADRLLGLEAREVLRDAMGDLTDPQRVVVGLRDVEGFETDEVAELLDLTPGHVRVLLHRGRGKLRSALAEYVEA
jgi:RNA polymerase sigma-70 factor, ECF subfamily